MMRLDENTPARRAFVEAIKVDCRKKRHHAVRWIDIIKKDLSVANINLDFNKPHDTLLLLQRLTENRKNWKDIIHQVCETNVI